MSILKAGLDMGKFKLGRKLGDGACAEVYEVSGGNDLVIKLCPLATGKGKQAKEMTERANTLYYEYQLYNGIILQFTC